MKLTAKDAPGFLRQPDKAAAVLLYGPDSGLVRERGKAIAETILGKNADPLNRVELTGDQMKSDPARLRDELCALSLMGGRRLVLLQNVGEKSAAAIVSAFDGLETTTYLIVEADELAASSSLRQLFEKESRFAALACYRDEGRSLEDVIRAALGANGLRATPDALHYLVASLGNDRRVTEGEIEKIALYMGMDREVTLETAMLLTGHNATESLEDICHAVAFGKNEEAHDLLLRLIQDGTQPVAVIRSLIRHFQRLDIAAAHMASGMGVEQAMGLLRPPVFFKYAPLVKRELSRLSPALISRILSLLLRTEKELKSSLLSPTLLADHALQQATRLGFAH